MPKAKSRINPNIVPQFAEVQNFTAGYHDKLQDDEVPPGAAVVGSYNFILDVDGKWTTRGGSKYLGTKSADTGGVTSSAKLVRRDGIELPIIFYSTKSAYFNPDALDWKILDTGYTSGLIFGRAMMEKLTDSINSLIFCNLTDAYYVWKGATGVVSSFTANTIVLTGAVTLANLGFDAAGSVSDNGTMYAYTGISGQTFTGVTPSPVGVMTAGNQVTQQPVSYASLDRGNVITVLNGRIVMFTKPAAAIYGGGSIRGSVLNDPTSFSQSSPRIASEGFQLLMAEGGGSGKALASWEGGLACFKNNAVSKLTVSLDSNDLPALQPLLPYDETASGHVGCVGSKSTFSLGQSVLFVTPTKNILSLQRVLDSNYPQPLPFSDRIQSSVNDLIWDEDCCGIGFDYLGFLCGKTSDSSVPNTQLIYDQRYDAWWTPFTGQEISSYFVYGGKLHGTLANSPDAIELLTGTTDYATSTTLGQKIDCKLILGRSNYGKNGTQTKVKSCFVEGWMSKAGIISVAFAINESGKQINGTIRGDGDSYFFDPVVTDTFSDSPFSANTFGGQFLTSKRMPDGVGHFRIIFYFEETPIWNIQPSFQTSDYFKLICCGFDAKPSNVAPPSDLNLSMS